MLAIHTVHFSLNIFCFSNYTDKIIQATDDLCVIAFNLKMDKILSPGKGLNIKKEERML